MTDLIRVVCEQPDEDTPRGALKDWLMEAGEWDWDTVNSLVCQFPKSDGLRLLAADFLVDDGQPGRAEFVKIQLALSKAEPIGHRTQQVFSGATGDMPVDEIYLGPRWSPGVLELQHREQELFKDSGPLWWNNVPGSWRSVGWSSRGHTTVIQTADGWEFGVARGFISSVFMSAAEWIKRHADLTAQFPIEVAWLATAPDSQTASDVLGNDRPVVRGRCRLVGMPWVETDAVIANWKKTGGGLPGVTTERMLAAYYWPSIEVRMPPVLNEETTFEDGVHPTQQTFDMFDED